MEKHQSIDPIGLMDEYFLDLKKTCDYLQTALHQEMKDAGYVAGTLHMFPSGDSDDFLHLICMKDTADFQSKTLAVLPSRKIGTPDSLNKKGNPDQRGRPLGSYRIETLCMELKFLLEKERDRKNRTALTCTLDSLKEKFKHWWNMHMA